VGGYNYAPSLEQSSLSESVSELIILAANLLAEAAASFLPAKEEVY